MQTNHRFFKRFSALFLAVLLFFGGAFAAQQENYSEKIIGRQNSTQAAPLGFFAFFTASAEKIHLYYFNIHLSPIAAFSGELRAGREKAQRFSRKNIPPLHAGRLSFDSPMQKSSEQIQFTYRVRGKKAGLDGSRSVPEALFCVWDKGTFQTLFDSLNYHYQKHGEEVEAGNIVSYLEKAFLYRENILQDRQSLSSSRLQSIYRITKSKGPSKASKFKHLSNFQFAILSDAGLYLLSYGK